jgi:hypothetical protein
MVSQRVPAFGGYSWSAKDDVFYIYLQDPSALEEAIRVLEEDFYNSDRRPLRYEVRQADFSMIDLKRWKDCAAESVSGEDGINSMNIVGNRVVMTVVDQAATQLLQEKLGGLGVPLEAVNISISPPISLLSHTLRMEVRPLIGGLRRLGPRH